MEFSHNHRQKEADMSKQRRQQTFDQGVTAALELAVVTLARSLGPAERQRFISDLRQNVELWDDLSLPSTTTTDEWLSGLREGVGGLVNLVERP